MSKVLNSKELFDQVVKLNWRITEVNGSGFEEYIKGEEFKLAGCSEEFESIVLNQKSLSAKIETPYFLCIKPTWFVREGVLYLTLIAGNKVQDLTRLVMWFDEFDCTEPKFKFEITPLFDNPFRSGGGQETAQAKQESNTKTNEQQTISAAFAMRSSSSGIRGMGIGH